MSYNSWTVLSQIQKGKNKITKALKKRFNLLKRLAKRDIAKQVTKKVAGEAIKNAPSLYYNGVPRVKYKRVRKGLDSNFANTALNYCTAYAQDRLNRY